MNNLKTKKIPLPVELSLWKHDDITFNEIKAVPGVE
jgi:hypothetical protein